MYMQVGTDPTKSQTYQGVSSNNKAPESTIETLTNKIFQECPFFQKHHDILAKIFIGFVVVLVATSEVSTSTKLAMGGMMIITLLLAPKKDEDS